MQDVYRPQNWNPYAYAWNNPLRYTDPTGMFNVGRFLQWAAYAVRIAGALIPAFRPIAMVIGQYLNYASIAHTFATGGSGARMGAAFSMRVGGGDMGSFGGFARGLIVGRLSSRIAGGKFKDGALGALKSMAINGAIDAMGTAYPSRQTGGKQANGAGSDAQRLALNDPRGAGELDRTPAEARAAKHAVLKAAKSEFEKLAQESFSTIDEAAMAWQDRIDPIAREHDVDAASFINRHAHNDYRVDQLISDGYRFSVEIGISFADPIYVSVQGGALYAFSTAQMLREDARGEYANYSSRRVR